MAKVVVIGNCQIAALQSVLEITADDLHILRLPSVHTMDERHRKDTELACREADWIVSQPISDTYQVDFVRTGYIREQYANKLIVWPSIQFAGYTPEVRCLHDLETRNFEGPLFGYHNEKILIGFLEGWSVAKTESLLTAPSSIDELWYRKTVEDSLSELSRREENCDVRVSEYIRDNFADRRLFHVFSHPSLVLIVQAAKQINRLIGKKSRVIAPSWLMSDFEMLSAWYPENVYISEIYGFKFKHPRVYRGMKPDEVEGRKIYRPQNPLLYSEVEMIEECFQFYATLESRLRENGAVQSLMSRPRT